MMTFATAGLYECNRVIKSKHNNYYYRTRALYVIHTATAAVNVVVDDNGFPQWSHTRGVVVGSWQGAFFDIDPNACCSIHFIVKTKFTTYRKYYNIVPRHVAPI